MSREITVVFQDCPLCGDRGRVLKQIVATEGVRVHKVSFATEEGRDLIHEAVFEHGIKTMPFYVYGDKFSEKIEDLLEPEPKKANKTGTKKKGESNEHLDETL